MPLLTKAKRFHKGDVLVMCYMDEGVHGEDVDPYEILVLLLGKVVMLDGMLFFMPHYLYNIMMLGDGDRVDVWDSGLEEEEEIYDVHDDAMKYYRVFGRVCFKREDDTVRLLSRVARVAYLDYLNGGSMLSEPYVFGIEM